MVERKKKAAAGPGKFTVYRDTSEKAGHGWQYEASDRCLGTVRHNLYTGDYSLEGLYEEKAFVIERKGRVEEFAGNLTDPAKWKDFEAELERMEEFRWPFLVLEFSVRSLLYYPNGTSLPAHLKRSTKIRGPYLLKLVNELEMKFKTKIVWAGDKGKEYSLNLLKRAWECWHSE